MPGRLRRCTGRPYPPTTASHRRIACRPGGASGVVVDAQGLRQRVALTGQDVSRLDLARLERVVVVHGDLALEHLGAAGAAAPALARERRVAASPEHGVENGHVVSLEPEAGRPAVEGDRDL